MLRSIVQQQLSVSFFRAAGSPPWEGFRYKSRPVIDPAAEVGPAGVLEFVRIPSWPGLESQADQLRGLVDDLVTRSRYDRTREHNEFDLKAAGFAKNVLPPRGLAGMIEKGCHPELEIDDDYASPVPWECLQEFHWVCPPCGTMSDVLDPPRVRECPRCHRPAHLVTDENSVATFRCPDCQESSEVEKAPFCSRCGKGQKLALIRLATDYFTSHWLLPQRGLVAHGNRFLIVDDPTSDLHVEGADHDHIARITQMVTARGLKPITFPRKEATREAVLTALADPGLMGVFFFGHGWYDARDKRSLLVLSDGPLMPDEIVRAHPRARLVFLNACYGGTRTAEWGIDGVCRSVAQAFAQGGAGRVVIAPFCPVVNKDAARTLKEFLDGVQAGKSLGEAFLSARRQSLRRYEMGAADTSWMTYRYLGDPNMLWPVPEGGHVEVVERGEAWPCRVFDRQNVLQLGTFAFGIDAVLLRAAKRKNLQGRLHATVADFVAGLVRKGELTRYLLTQENVVPDRLYEQFGQIQESGERQPAGAGSRLDGEEPGTCSRAHRGLREEAKMGWTLGDRSDFTPELADILVRADRMAQQRQHETGDNRISEEDVLSALIGSPHWPSPTMPLLPPAEVLRRAIEKRPGQREVDRNGEILLDGLDEETSKTLRYAYSIALRRGVCPIPTRALLAGMTEDEDCYGSAVFACCGFDPKFISSCMKATISDEKGTVDWFGLGIPACSRVITPVLGKAREAAMQRQNRIVTSIDLFRAFWSSSDLRFKQALRQLLQIDPERLAFIDPEDPDRAAREVSARYPDFRKSNFDEAVWRMLSVAANLALVQNAGAIRTPHLFVGMISDGTVAREFLQQNGLDRSLLTIVFLSTIPCPSVPQGSNDLLELSPNARKVLSRATELAQERHRVRPTEHDVFKAFFENGGSIVGKGLRLLGVQGPMRLPSRREDTGDGVNILGERLSGGTVGQAVAIRVILDFLREPLGRRDRPWRILAFAGLPGTGRGTVLRILGEWLAGTPEGVLRVNLAGRDPQTRPAQPDPNASGGDAHALRRTLADWLSVHPCSVLEFEGVAQADADGYAVLLQLLSRGVVARPDGNTSSARRTIVVLPCEPDVSRLAEILCGVTETTQMSHSLQEALRDVAQGTLSREILDLVDGVVPFGKPDENDLAAIAARTAKRILCPLEVLHGVPIDVDAGVWSWLARRNSRDREPASAIAREVRREVIVPLLAHLDTVHTETATRVTCRVVNDKILWETLDNGGTLRGEPAHGG